MAREYPTEFLADFERLMAWINELSLRFGPSLQVRVVDPQSPEGLWKCLRYGVRRYPAFIVNGRKRLTGWDKAALDSILEGEMSTGRAARQVDESQDPGIGKGRWLEET